MKLFAKAIIASFAALMFAGAAQAGTTSLGGVVVPTGTDGLAEGTIIVDLGPNGVDLNNPDLSGVSVFGKVEDIGEHDGFGGIIPPGTWSQLDNGVELTYELSLTPTGVTDLGGGIFEISVTGSITYYLDDSPDFNGANPATASDGNIFLTADLVMEEVFQIDDVLDSIFAPDDLEFAVTGGLYADNFDTDSFNLGSDILTFSAEANFGSIEINSGILTGSLAGRTGTLFRAVPEPMTIGLLGAGLLGLGLARRRRKIA
ncbi:MAG: PEP-CTERM sorting domain-containing protein [Sphingomonadales bacterium]|jgi:hypothetical protein